MRLDPILLVLLLCNFPSNGRFTNSTIDASAQPIIEDPFQTESIATNDVVAHNDTDDCPEKSADEDNVSYFCKFWIQGILLVFVGCFGIIGNSVILLHRENLFGFIPVSLAVY